MGQRSSKKRSFVQANKDLTDPEKQGDFNKNVNVIFVYLESFKQWPDQMKVRKEAGNRMLETSLNAICDKLVDSLKTGSANREEPHETLQDKGTAISKKEDQKPPPVFVDDALDLLVLLTEPECGYDVCECIVQNEGLLQKLISNMEKNLKNHRSLSILHNLAAHEAEVKDGYKTKTKPKPKDGITGENQFQKNLDLILEKLKQLTKTDQKDVKLLATVALACVSDRDTTIMGDLLQFMASHLCLALDEPEHRSHTCSATAMERACIDSLWLLCREETCKADMAEDGKLTNLLCDMYNDHSNPFQEQAAFILVNLRDYLKKKPKHLCLNKDEKGHQLDIEKRLQETQQSKKSTDDQHTTPAQSHVMLSYQTKYRETILDVKHKLEDHGIKTWMDHYDIRKYRDAFEAMADAVEKCGVFLMAVCEEYQKSDNCKREAEYAITLNRTVIPLMVQKDFKPSSWLGLIQGSQMYYDLTETNDDERKKCFVDLIEEIKTKMGEAQQKAGQTSSGQTGEGKSVQGKTGVETKVDTFQKGKDTLPATTKSPTQVHASGTNGDVTRRWNGKGRTAAVHPTKGGLRRSFDDKNTPRQQPLPYQRPKPLSVVIPYCRIHPNSTCNAKGDGYNHCCCHVEDPRKEVRDWLKRYRLDGHDTISSLTKKDLLSLVCLKTEAPDFFYQRIWNDLKMKKFSEIEHFKAALADWEAEDEE